MLISKLKLSFLAGLFLVSTMASADTFNTAPIASCTQYGIGLGDLTFDCGSGHIIEVKTEVRDEVPYDLFKEWANPKTGLLTCNVSVLVYDLHSSSGPTRTIQAGSVSYDVNTPNSVVVNTEQLTPKISGFTDIDGKPDSGKFLFMSDQNLIYYKDQTCPFEK